MKNSKFEKWLSTMRKSISGYDYYTDFESAYKKAEENKAEIYILNSLVASKNIENDFESLINKYPQCLKAIPILLAVRNYELYCQDENGAINYSFNRKVQTIEQYKYFMRNTGLFNLLENHIISNLYDYVTGVEVGLGSNVRKNRGGKQMERLIKRHVEKLNKTYYTELNFNDIKKNWGIDISAITSLTTKRFDFVIKTDNSIFLIETNFYATSGSKLNEVARSYTLLSHELEKVESIEFIWITDGNGWYGSKATLEEAYNSIKYLYNIADLENGVLLKIIV